MSERFAIILLNISNIPNKKKKLNKIFLQIQIKFYVQNLKKIFYNFPFVQIYSLIAASTFKDMINIYSHIMN